MYSSNTVLPYLFSTISRFSASVHGIPNSRGLKCIARTFPSVELASKMFPLKPQLRSVIPIMKASIKIAIGFFNYGFHTVIVDSAEASAMIL